jgi:hypothetical protein
MAREFGDQTTMRRVGKALAKMSNGRNFDGGGGDLDEFGYFFRFGEAFPRGQESALLMLADIMDGGDWFEAFRLRDTSRFSAPTVEGVAYPDLGVSAACNDEQTGVLNVHTYAATRRLRGEPTRFRVARLPDARTVTVKRNGETFGGWRALNEHEIEIDAAIDTHRYEIHTGYRSASVQTMALSEPRAAASGSSSRRASTPIEIISATRAVAAGAASCPCCAGVI